MHKLGLTSMFLASKFEDLNPLNMCSVYSKIGHKQIPKDIILNTERNIFQRLGFSVSLVTSYDFLTLFVENFIA